MVSDTLIIMIIGTVGALLALGYVAKIALKGDEYSKKLKKSMDRYIAELEDENKVLQKSMNAMKKGAKISKDDLDNPLGAIQSLIPQFEHLVPAKFKPFLRDPKLMEYATKMISENPEAAKKILSNFVSKGGANKELAGEEDGAISV
jgi:hypothetical protein